MQRAKASENVAGNKQIFAEDVSEDLSEDRSYHFYWSISGNLRGRLLSSEKFLEVLTLWVFTLSRLRNSVGTDGIVCAGPPICKNRKALRTGLWGGGGGNTGRFGKSAFLTKFSKVF